jgi:hypothetical protein
VAQLGPAWLHRPTWLQLGLRHHSLAQFVAQRTGCDACAMSWSCHMVTAHGKAVAGSRRVGGRTMVGQERRGYARLGERQGLSAWTGKRTRARRSSGAPG